MAICGCQWRCHRHVAVSGAAGRTAAAAASAAVRGSLALQHENLFRLNQDGNLLWCDVGRDATAPRTDGRSGSPQNVVRNWVEAFSRENKCWAYTSKIM